MPLPSFLQRFRPGAHSRVHQAPPLSPADIEAARVRARRRMIGMAVLVGAGVIGFPWLFETQPRPLSSDITVVNASAPSAVAPTAPVTSSAAASRGSNLPAVVANASDAMAAAEVARADAGRNGASDEVSASSRDAQASRALEEEVIETEEGPASASVRDSERDSGTARSAAKVGAVAAVPAAVIAAKAAHDEQAAQAKAKAEAKAHQEAKARQEAKLKAEAKAKADAKLKAEALAKAAAEARQKAQAQAKAKTDAVVAKADPKHAASKPVPKPEVKITAKPEPAKADSDTRYIVQVGAFGDATAAHEARMKVERLGIKTYTHEIGAGNTRKIRVRVGPYATKAEADRAMNTLRKGGLSGALLTL